MTYSKFQIASIKKQVWYAKYHVSCIRIKASDIKERVHSEMKISLIKKGIFVTVPIRVISFRLFYFSWRKGYGKIMQVLKQ